MINRGKHTKKDYKAFTIKNNNYNEITTYMRNNQYEKALDLLVDFIIEYPNDYCAKYDYAICLIKTDQVELGILELEFLRKRCQKRVYSIYKNLVEYYIKKNAYETVESLLEEAKTVLTDFELKFLKARYYYSIGCFKDGDQILEDIDTKDKSELAKIYICKISFLPNIVLRQNRKQIEKELALYTKKISVDSARRIYLKLYIACSDYEEAYKYIVTDLSKGVKPLLISYDVCTKLGKNFEAQKYLNLINSYELPDTAKLVKVQILYINDKKEEAFDLCKIYAKEDLDAACMLCDYSIKLDRTSEAIEVLSQLLSKREITNNKTINVIERLLGLYIYEQRYQEAYDLLEKYNIYFNVVIKEEFYTYLSKKLNIWYSQDPNINSYIVSQLREYDYDKAVEHIEKHKYEDNKKIIHTIFKDDLTGQDIMEIVRPYLTKENLYELGTVLKYQIDCKDLNINEKIIVVGKIANQDDIVFCFPAKMSIIEDEDIQAPKAKRISQLIKFKNRYNV